MRRCGGLRGRHGLALFYLSLKSEGCEFGLEMLMGVGVEVVLY